MSQDAKLQFTTLALRRALPSELFELAPAIATQIVAYGVEDRTALELQLALSELPDEAHPVTVARLLLPEGVRLETIEVELAVPKLPGRLGRKHPISLTVVVVPEPRFDPITKVKLEHPAGHWVFVPVLDHACFVDRKEDLAARVMEITGGRGAELIFDAVAGRSMEALAAAAAREATIFVYGALSMKPTVFPLDTALKKGLGIRGFTLYEILSVPERMERARKYIFDGLKSGALWPVIDRIFPFESIVEAHRYMESNRQNGKIVVTV